MAPPRLVQTCWRRLVESEKIIRRQGSFLRWHAMLPFAGLSGQVRGASQSYNRLFTKKRLLTASTSLTCHTSSLNISVARSQTAGYFLITAISHLKASGFRWLSLLKLCCQVEIGWPMPVWSDKKQREHVAECLEAGEVVEITPMFGLIHSFRVLAT